MNNCCQLNYEETFNEQKSLEELNDYRLKGVKDSTRPMVEALKKLSLEGRTLLDIGGGIGAIVFELFDRGISKATHVEIASAYVDTFQAEAERRLPAASTISFRGDYLRLHEQIEPADLVTLDKVICCYEQYRELVSASTRKALRWYAYSIPRNVWWVKWGHWIEQQVKSLRGNRFPVFLHPADEIGQQVAAAGFREIEQIHHKEWLIAVFKRI